MCNFCCTFAAELVENMTKEEQYQEVIPQINSLIAGETDLIANMANIAAVLHNTFHFWWTGFYLVKEKSSIINHKSENLSANNRLSEAEKEILNHKSENLSANNRLSEAEKEILNHKSEILNHKSQLTNELVLGPFQGPIACTRIPYNKGVCGTAWAQNKTLIVPNVHEFPGHIACSSLSKSEIVVPIRRDGEIIAVLDIDSADYNTFDAIDQKYLEQIIL